MTSEAHTHHFSSWAKERIDEMDATLTSIEGRLGALHADAKKQAEKVVSEIRAQREIFQEALRKGQHQGDAAWTKAKADLHADWTSFESIVQRYMSEARQNTEQQQATFKARAEAQRKAWQETIDALRGKVTTFAEGKKQDLDAALAHLKADAETAKSNLEKNRKTGEQSWAALHTALEESRTAFDKASQRALEAFKKAA
ncbi:MAG: hypothetical protein ACLPPF_17610 [Rhodomicrobium sp.]